MGHVAVILLILVWKKWLKQFVMLSFLQHMVVGRDAFTQLGNVAVITCPQLQVLQVNKQIKFATNEEV